MDAKRIYIGSWFQRTTLHLSEIYDFLIEANSPLNLDSNKLIDLRDNLELISVEDIVGDFEYIKATVKKDIVIKIYEDGLITLGRDPEGDIADDIDALKSYYEKLLSPALKYIFSLGAPIPKELANIKTVYPFFVVLENSSKEDIHKLLNEFDQRKHFEIKENTFEVYRGDKLYIVNSIGEPLDNIERFIEEQIFIREFKGQMHRYLNLHRVIWENIAEVKEAGEIKGRDIKEFKSKVEGYQKTINMIDTRINQMGVYISTRGSIAKNNPDMEKFADVLQFKYETLKDTLSYIKDIWEMTKMYVNSAVEVFSDLQAKATNNSIKNLTVVTSMGVGASLIALFTKNSLPEFTLVGLGYFVALVAIGWSTNKIMRVLSLRKKYSIKNIKADKNIK